MELFTASTQSIFFGKNQGTQCDRCKACRSTFQTLRKSKKLSLKAQAQKLLFEGLGLRDNGKILGCIIKRFPAGLPRPLSSYQLLNFR